MLEQEILHITFSSFFDVYIWQCKLDGLECKSIAERVPFEDTVQRNPLCVAIVDVQNLWMKKHESMEWK